MTVLERLGLSLPIIQAPMAGVSNPAMAAAVSNAGGLGSIAIGAVDPPAAREMILATRAATARPFQVNTFVHAPARRDARREHAWIEALTPEFDRFGTAPPASLREIYASLIDDRAMQALLLDMAPPVVSFHFGVPDPGFIAALKARGVVLMATATQLSEAEAIIAAGVDVVVAQGIEAGGHRGMFDPGRPDPALETLDLTRQLTGALTCPVIAAGGIMSGSDIRAALDAGAIAAQLGTAFVGCAESSADDGYRQALSDAQEGGTVLTSAISGRPARCLTNRFTRWARETEAAVPDYPVAYDAGKALNAAAKSCGESGYGAQWAGTGAPRARALPAAELVAQLASELSQTA